MTGGLKGLTKPLPVYARNSDLLNSLPEATAVAELRFKSAKYAMAVVEKVDPAFLIPIERELAGPLYRSGH